MTPDEKFLDRVRGELVHARQKFPAPDGTLAVLTKKVGEVAKGSRVEARAVQVATMALRLAVEGDPTLDALRTARAGRLFTPEAEFSGFPLIREEITIDRRIAERRAPTIVGGRYAGQRQGQRRGLYARRKLSKRANDTLGGRRVAKRRKPHQDGRRGMISDRRKVRFDDNPGSGVTS